MLPQGLVVRDLALEHRDLDAVVACRFEGCDLAVVRLGHVRRPQQHVEPDLHVRPLPVSQIADLGGI